MTDAAIRPAKIAQDTTFTVLFAIGFCHLLNDMMQALLPAIYPTLKARFHLSFAQIGLITAGLPVHRLAAAAGGGLCRRHPAHALFAGARHGLDPGGAGAAVGGAQLSGGAGRRHADRAGLVGVPSRIQPRGAHGVGRAPRPGAIAVPGGRQYRLGAGAAGGGVRGGAYGQRGVAWYAACALLAIVILFAGRHLVQASRPGAHQPRQQAAASHTGLPRGKVVASVAILLLLIFSKYFYLASITSYFTFYLIHTFGVSVAQAQLHLFVFLGAVAAGTFMGGPLGDQFGRKYVIWFSILGMLPFTLMLPYANLFWTGVLSMIIGVILASAFPAIVVYAQELLPGQGRHDRRACSSAFPSAWAASARRCWARWRITPPSPSSIRCAPSCR